MMTTVMIAAPSTIPRRERSDANKKFANDGSLESVDFMLQKLAAKCHKRVASMGLPMELEDVLQEMRLGYLRALEKWKSDGGSLFSTYCMTVCLNNFNQAIKKMERDRKVLGMSSIDSFASEDGSGSTPAGDIRETMMQFSSPANDSPDYRLYSSQETTRKLASLSANAKRLVGMLLEGENQSVQPSPKLSQLAAMAQIEGVELRRVKIEILNTFGTSWR